MYEVSTSLLYSNDIIKKMTKYSYSYINAAKYCINASPCRYYINAIVSRFISPHVYTM